MTATSPYLRRSDRSLAQARQDIQAARLLRWSLRRAKMRQDAVQRIALDRLYQQADLCKFNNAKVSQACEDMLARYRKEVA